MNWGDKQERVISTMGILKGRYFVMTAFNWSRHFWIEYNMGFLLSSSKRWQHSVSSEKVIVKRMACVAWMSEQEFWWIDGWIFSLLKPCMLSTRAYFDPTFDNKNPQEIVWGRTEVWHSCFGSKMESAQADSPLVFMTLIEREPLKRTANLPSRRNPTGNFSCREMLNYSSSFCASVQCPQLFYLLLLWETLSHYSFKKHNSCDWHLSGEICNLHMSLAA